MAKRYGVVGSLVGLFPFGTTYSEGLLALPAMIEKLLYIRSI